MRFIVSFVLVVAMTSGIALADGYIRLTGDLKPWDTNQCTVYGNGFRCSLGYGKSTSVTAHNRANTNGCGIRIYNQGSLFKGDKWHIEFFKTHFSKWDCTYHWVGDNTVEIIPPQ